LCVFAFGGGLFTYLAFSYLYQCGVITSFMCEMVILYTYSSFVGTC